MSWHAEGACAGMPVAIWFEPIPSYISRARFVCSLCPLRARCVSEAITNGDEGIRGGLTYLERKALPQPRLPIAHRVAA